MTSDLALQGDAGIEQKRIKAKRLLAKQKLLNNSPSYGSLSAAGNSETIIDGKNGEEFSAAVGTSQELSFIQNDDVFDTPSSSFEEAGAQFEKQAAFIALVANAYGLIADDEVSGFVADRSRALASAQSRQPEYMQEFNKKFEEANGFFEGAGVILSSPRAIGRQVITQSANAAIPLITTAGGAKAGVAIGGIGGSVVPVVGTGAGAVGGGIVGGATGAFTGGAIVEIGAEIDGMLQEAGVDVTDANQVFDALQNDTLMQDIKIKAERKGITTAAVDSLFQIVGGRFLKAAKVRGAGKAATAVAGTADVAVQSVGEGVGEAAGQFAKDGRVEWKEAALEAVTSLGQSTGQTAIGATVGQGTPKIKEIVQSKIADTVNKLEKIEGQTQIDVDALDAEISAAERDIVSAIAENQLAQIEAAQQADILVEAEGLKSQVDAIPNVDINKPSSFKKALGRTPETISQFIKKAGGIVDKAGELKARDITTKSGVGIIRKDTSSDANQISIDGSQASIPDNANIDFIKEKVFDAGYFPDKTNYNEISDTELFDAIASDINGEKVYTASDLIEINEMFDGTKDIEQGMLERGIDREMSVDQIADVIREERNLGKFTETTLVDVEAMQKSISEANLSKDVEAIKNQDSGIISGSFLEKGKEGLREFTLKMGKHLVPISQRIKNISPNLFARMRLFEFQLEGQIISDLAEIDQFLVGLSKLKRKSKDAYIALDLALKNRNDQQAASLAESFGIKDQYDAYISFRDNIHERALNAGLDIGHLQDYFPRHVNDLDGLMDYFEKQKYWSEIEKAIAIKEEKLGRKLESNERAIVANTLALGRSVEGINLKKSGFLKERTIEKITVETNKFYDASEKALVSYVHSMNNAIETARLFGKSSKIGGEFLNIEDSIGNFIQDEVSKESLSNRDVRILRDILNARFNGKSMGMWMGAFRDLSYIDVMGSQFSTITQFGDIAPSIYYNGLLNTLTTIPSAAIDKTKVNLRDINIQDIAQEFDNNGLTSKGVDYVFKATGFNKIDRIGKLTLINSSLKKAQQDAKSGNRKLTDYLNILFGEEAPRVLQDIKDGNATEDVKFYLFNKLLDVQPVSKLEMPEYYLSSGNWKILYLLKSFTIKQLNMYREEGFSKMYQGIAEKKPKLVIEGIRNFAYLYGLYVASGASADWMKDFVRNLLSEEDYIDEPEDYVVDNMLKSFGFSRYQVNMITKQGATDVFFDFFLPPTKAIDNIQKDMEKFNDEGLTLENSRSIKSIPVFGEATYFWLGGGSGRENKKNDRGLVTDPK